MARRQSALLERWSSELHSSQGHMMAISLSYRSQWDKNFYFIYLLRPSPWVTLNKMSFWKVLVLAKKKSPCYKTCLFSNDLSNKSFTNKHVVSQSDLLTKPAPKTLKGQYRLHYNNLEVKHRPKRRVWHKGTSKLDACSDGLMSSVESGFCNRGWIIAIERLENSCGCFWNSCR